MLHKEAPEIINHSIRRLHPRSPGCWTVTKTYGAERGLSAAFRQWRASSHCHFIHGYALSFAITFVGDRLDDRNWLIDFGDLHEVKAFLERWFDHTLVIAQDDPKLNDLMMLALNGLADIRVLPNVGVEAFAEFVAKAVDMWLSEHLTLTHVQVKEVKVSEHPANSASWVNYRP